MTYGVIKFQGLFWGFFFNIEPLYQLHEKFKNAQDAEEKTENLTLSRNQPRFGPGIIDKGGALTMTGRPMTCFQCLIDVPSTKKKERVRSRFCCVSCQKPVCLKKHAQVVCAECFQNLVTNSGVGAWLKKVGSGLRTVTQKRNQGRFPVTLGYTKA